jgi:hypothetical protein
MACDLLGEVGRVRIEARRVPPRGGDGCDPVEPRSVDINEIRVARKERRLRFVGVKGLVHRHDHALDRFLVLAVGLIRPLGRDTTHRHDEYRDYQHTHAEQEFLHGLLQ